MKRKLFPLTFVVVFSLLTIGGAASPVAAPVQPPGLTPPCTAAMRASIPACPLTGCGDGGDAFLNQAKNRSDVPRSSTTKTLDEMRALDQPPRWETGSPRDSIQGPGKEGSAVAVRGFLLKARAEGAESCNCALTKRVDTDIHLILVSKLPDFDDQDEVDAAEAGSVTAEITPRLRRNGHPAWVHKNINDFEGEYIRVTGRLMLDTKHLPPNRKLKRATNWEVHPITRFQVCQTTKARCDSSTGAPNWKNF